MHSSHLCDQNQRFALEVFLIALIAPLFWLIVRFLLGTISTERVWGLTPYSPTVSMSRELLATQLSYRRDRAV